LIAVKAKDAAVPAAWPARCRRSHDHWHDDLRRTAGILPASRPETGNASGNEL